MDGYDTRRNPGYSDSELTYIVRNTLGLEDRARRWARAARRQRSCVPHNRCATAANKSLTSRCRRRSVFSPRATRRTPSPRCTPRLKNSLDAIYGDKRYTAVAIHPRNEDGQIHSRARSRRKPRRGSGDRQTSEPQQRWRNHGASLAHPAKDHVEGGTGPRIS